MSIAEQHYEDLLGTRPPRQPNINAVMARPRVAALIDTGSSAALCIVRGPRNCGKSVALRQWSAGTTKDLLWLTLTQRATAPQQFWIAVRAALGAHLGMPATPPDDPYFANSPAHYLAVHLSGAEPVTLILEDFHWAQGSGVEHGLLELLDCAPELSLIIVARSALDVEQQQISSDVDLHVVDPPSLRFSTEEAAQFHAGTVLEPISVVLNERLFGAPVLHKAARRVSGEPRQQILPFADDIVQKVTDALRREVSAVGKAWLSTDAVDLVSATLPLTYFDLALAQVVAPDAATDAVVRELAEAGVLWSLEASGPTTYGYPAVIRDILEVLLADTVAVRRCEVLAAAAALEFAREAYLPAFTYALENEDFALGSSMLVKSGLHLLFQGGSDFSAVLKKVPNYQMVRYPLLSLSLGLIYNRDKRTRVKGLEYFTLALAASNLLGKSQPPEQKLAVSLAQAVALRLTGQFKLAAATARSSLMDHAELPLADRDQLGIFETIALGHWGLTLLFVGDFTQATQALHQSVAVAEQLNSVQAAFFATSVLAYRYAVDGDLRTAAEYAQCATDMRPDMPAIELYQQTPLNMALAMIELGTLRPDAAEQHLVQVISEASTSEFWARLRVLEAQIDMLRGRAGTALARLGLVLANRKELPPVNPIDATALAGVQADLLLATGDASGAAAALRKLPAKNTATVVAQARLGLAMGRPARVVELLSGRRGFGTVLQSLEAQVLLTVARLHLQPGASVRAEIEQISGAVPTLQTHWPLAMLSAADLGLLHTAAQELGMPCPDFAPMPHPLVPASLSLITLTPRESTILAALATTGDRAEIARMNFVSVNTVKTQLRTLYKKLGVTSRDEALLAAHQEKLWAP